MSRDLMSENLAFVENRGLVIYTEISLIQILRFSNSQLVCLRVVGQDYHRRFLAKNLKIGPGIKFEIGI
jgi:hypothetical protein